MSQLSGPQSSGPYGQNNPPPPPPGSPPRKAFGTHWNSHLTPQEFVPASDKASTHVRVAYRQGSPPAAENSGRLRQPLEPNKKHRKGRPQKQILAQSYVLKYAGGPYDRDRSCSPARMNDLGEDRQYRERSLAHGYEGQYRQEQYFQFQSAQHVGHAVARTSNEVHDQAQNPQPRQHTVEEKNRHAKYDAQGCRLKWHTLLKNRPHTSISVSDTGKRNRSYHARAKRRTLKEYAAICDTQRHWSPTGGEDDYGSLADPYDASDAHNAYKPSEISSPRGDSHPDGNRRIYEEHHDCVLAPVAQSSHVDVEDEVDWDDENLEAVQPSQTSTAGHQCKEKSKNTADSQQDFGPTYMRGSFSQKTSRSAPPPRRISTWREQRQEPRYFNVPQKGPQFEQRVPTAKSGQGHERSQDRRFDDLNFLHEQTGRHELSVHHKVKTQPQPQLDASCSSKTRGLEIPAPPTAHNLRGYEALILSRPQPYRFKHGDGKVAPHHYGSSRKRDLGLCFATFCTKFACELGVSCPWRHHPLTKTEINWIVMIGGKNEEKFLGTVDKWWAFPDVPVPGACMHGRGN